MEEEWRRMTVYTLYEISSQQRVREYATGRLIHITHNGSGYPMVWLKTASNGRQKVGRLVGKLFRETFPDHV